MQSRKGGLLVSRSITTGLDARAAKPNRGMTVVDLRPLKELAGRPEATTEVLMSVDQHQAFRVILDAIGSFA